MRSSESRDEERWPSPTDRGVSEVLSYSLVFALILVSVSIVSVSGVSTLGDVRDAEQIQNADRAYDVLADNMEDIYAEGAPSRATEIDLGDAELFIGEHTAINVTVHNGSLDLNESYVYETRPLVYRLDSDQALVYENGAIFRTHPDSGLIRRPPPHTYAADRLEIPIVRTRADSIRSVGSSTVLVRGQSASRSILESGHTDAWDTVYVNVTSPRADLWERYYEEEVALTAGDCGRPRDDRVVCELTAPSIVQVTLQDIKVSLIN